MTSTDRGWMAIACASWALAAATFVGGQAPSRESTQAAYLVRSLQPARKVVDRGVADRREVGSDLLDRPVLPGSVMKIVTLIAALEHNVITPETTHVCRRTVVVDGVRFVCAHPDQRRPLTAAEALAYSCNDFFVSLAPRLSREAFNRTRLDAGLPPIGNGVALAPALVGLDGPRMAPRAMLDLLARVAGFDRDRPMRLQEPTRRVLLEGLAGAAKYGSASALAEAGVSALAKTGTAPMPGGGAMGVVVALTPADRPERGIVVVAPGAAGLDAASIAASTLNASPAAVPPAAQPSKPAPAVRATTPASIRIGITGDNGRTSVKTMALEDYVAQVLAGEGEPRAGDGAQQALAIAIRTFALANRNRHRREGFDLCDTTHCQVLRAATATTKRAADATAGRVLLHEGQPAFVFYSAWCGGHLEHASSVWPGAVDYDRDTLDDDACASEPGWTSDLRASDVERALRAAGLRGDRLRDLRVESRTSSGRAGTLRAVGFSPATVSAHDFRMAVGRVLGWQRMKSTAFDLERTGAGYRFRGRGFGHGVGLCVVGAGRRAAGGATADDILKFYFPNLAISGVGALSTSRGSNVAAGATAKAEAPPASTAVVSAAGVQLALPADEERDRADVVREIVAARQDVARRTGSAVPASIRVTVHPTIESFGRATGQPWWVSAATLGSAIDLVPTAILRRQGLLERTLRHEIAHVIVDERLANRPMWVREGAALYLSGEDAPPERNEPRVSCPSDAELLRPVSAGAQRAAYARAEACFRRAIAGGKQWYDVK